MTEYWKNIEGYEGLYQVSNCGRVKSLNWNHTGEERVLKPGKDGGGYLIVSLFKNNKKKTFKVHRLVAEAFIPNPNSLPEVNHKDEDKNNNFVFLNEDGSVDEEKSNLEWCTRQYNLNYGRHNERVAKTQSKTVLQLRMDGSLVRVWSSTMEIQRQTGWSHGNISKCCNGKLKTSYGYRWSYILTNK